MLDLTEIFTLFIVMLGPLKILGPFKQRTQQFDAGTTLRIAGWTFLISTVAIVAGAFVGRSLLLKWQVSVPALYLAAGVVFFLVAVRQLLDQYDDSHEHAEPLPGVPFRAAARLVFPLVLTPYGIAAVIALVAASTDEARTNSIVGLAVIVMVIDLVAMLVARWIMVGFTVLVLKILGAVLAILQVALSIQIILVALRTLGIIPN